MYDIRIVILFALCIVLLIIVMVQWMLLKSKNQDITNLEMLMDGYVDAYDESLTELAKLRNEILQRNNDSVVIHTLKLYDAIAENKKRGIMGSENITLEV